MTSRREQELAETSTGRIFLWFVLIIQTPRMREIAIERIIADLKDNQNN